MSTEAPKDLIDIHKAVNLSGYSASSIYQAEIKRYGEGRHGRFSKADLLRWAEQKRKQGGASLPRRQSRSRARTRSTAVKLESLKVMLKGPSVNGHAGLSKAVASEVEAYVRTLQGSPIEIDATTFVDRAVRSALRQVRGSRS